MDKYLAYKLCTPILAFKRGETLLGNILSKQDKENPQLEHKETWGGGITQIQHS